MVLSLKDTIARATAGAVCISSAIHWSRNSIILQHFLGRGQVLWTSEANVGVFTVKAAKEVGENGVVVAVGTVH